MPGRYPFPAVPDGWFSVAASADVPVGEVVALHYLERELVAFRGEDGVARVFDAHCPHLGAHLGVGGKVRGNQLVCPFHGWCFNGDGTVAEVPRLERQPPRVSAGTWTVRELNDRVFVWFHALGEAPSYEPTPYRADGSVWTPWHVNRYRVRIGLQDLTENIIDKSHFWTVHDMVPPDNERQEVTFDGPRMTVDQHVKVTAVSAAGYEVRSVTVTDGPGIVAVKVTEGILDMLTYITQTPIDDEHVEITIHFSMKALENEAATATIAKMNDEITNRQFNQDVAIWENKIYRAKPPLTQVDGPVLQYRQWFRQFYSAQ
jgi:phenylpropionate dioxygenase-like ring-hydroxylating dioxygenase large terminal subunit